MPSSQGRSVDYGVTELEVELGGAGKVACVVTSGADCGGQTHADQALDVDMAAQATHQAGDLGAQRALVGVHLIQDQVPQRTVPEQLAVVAPGKQVLEHGVVGQQDVRRSILHRVPHVCGVPPV
ncbi:hypothetical protein GCM10022243_62060 [Saccharothrix violaceirubra]|uniref:Uncharacterized protein n=1 Tax=Saccharothrix violaceirubra TaxID=413306 RepID=A0A7W7T7T5_9PSEU|nr:hypothetical protein [Saccharothrix violaceirubra]MBB4968182.1 hypothetical protein [Saccharothrix violaceirubra]